MTSPVIDLAAERRNRRPIAGCARCEHRSDGQRCFSHRIVDLADSIREETNALDGELLVSADAVATVLADALGVLDGITNETLTVDERNAR